MSFTNLKEDDILADMKDKVANNAKEIEKYLIENNWESYVMKVDEDGDAVLTFHATVTKVSLRCSILVTDLTVRILVYLPVSCPPEYLPLLDEYLITTNYSLRYGAWARDASDNEVRFKCAYATEDELNKETFQLYFLFSLFKAADSYQDMVKLSVGKLSREKTEQAIQKYRNLINALEN